MPKKPPSAIIPRDQLQPGIDLCVAKAQRLNADAHTLATVAKSVGHAAVLFSYAVEEVGKAGLLWDALQTNQANQATVAGFANHTAKLERAETLLGEEALQLRPGAFARHAFASSGFDVGTYASELADRLEGLYVDWQRLTPGGRWKVEPGVDADCLQRAIEHLRVWLDAPRF